LDATDSQDLETLSQLGQDVFIDEAIAFLKNNWFNGEEGKKKKLKHECIKHE